MEKPPYNKQKSHGKAIPIAALVLGTGLTGSLAGADFGTLPSGKEIIAMALSTAFAYLAVFLKDYLKHS